MRRTRQRHQEAMEARWRRRFEEPPPIRAKATLLAQILNQEHRTLTPKDARNETDETLEPS
ncbi:MAG: hypothetical protein SGI91_00815 [Alphaproteobacteria bacterium]|nr:hypothetical protein [Alphaproteobacteria bacterium]